MISRINFPLRGELLIGLIRDLECAREEMIASERANIPFHVSAVRNSKLYGAPSNVTGIMSS